MFKGSFPALVTPFSGGCVDFDALNLLVDWQIAEGSHGLVPVGTTGESPTLDHDEHEAVIEAVVTRVDRRAPVIAGAGSNSTDEAVRFVRFAKKIGADAALVVTPYYNKPTQRGLLRHFLTLADCADIPIVVYNIPGRSAVDMSVATMAELAQHRNIVGVKDATGDIVRVSQTRAACGPDFVQFSGEDASALGFNVHGGVGCISVTANVAPGLCARFQEATLLGDYAQAFKLHERLMPLHEAIFAEPGVVGAKTGLSLLGRCGREVRSPLTECLPETEARIRAAMKGAGLI